MKSILHGPLAIKAAALLNHQEYLILLKELLKKPSFATELSKQLKENQSTISRRLNALERTGLIKSEWIKPQGFNRAVKVYEVSTTKVVIDLNDFLTGDDEYTKMTEKILSGRLDVTDLAQEIFRLRREVNELKKRG